MHSEEKTRGRDHRREMKSQRKSEGEKAQGAQKKYTKQKDSQVELKGVEGILGSTAEDFQVTASVR